MFCPEPVFVNGYFYLKIYETWTKRLVFSLPAVRTVRSPYCLQNSSCREIDGCTALRSALRETTTDRDNHTVLGFLLSCLPSVRPEPVLVSDRFA